MAIAAALVALTGMGALAATQQNLNGSVSSQVVSGTPDKKITRNGRVQRWQQREVKVHVDASVARVSQEAVAAVEQAFAVWMASGADVPKVTLLRGEGLTATLEPDGINAVVVAPITMPGHENDLAVTVGFSDSQTGEIVEADIIINSKYPIEPVQTIHSRTVAVTNDSATNPQATGDTTGSGVNSVGYDQNTYAAAPSCNGDPARGNSCGSRYDMESILAHEVGHFYGLGEDQKDGLSTMFYCTSECETHKRSLELDDVSTMVEVYADGYEEPGSVECAISAVGGRAPRPDGLWWVAGLALLALRRRKKT